MKKASAGFSLIELMIALAIMGILAAVSYPSYQRYVLSGYRTQATTMLLQLAAAQEKHLTNYGGYSEDFSALGHTTVNTSERYQFQVLLFAAGQEFELTAQAKGPQIADSQCQVFTLNHRGQRNSNLPDSQTCWP